MNVVVYPHDLGMGGSQLNAIELAAAVAAHGHPTVIFGRPGVLNSRIDELGLEFIEAPEPRIRPSLAVIRALRNLIDERKVDIVHGYEWPPALEAVMATRRRGVATVATVMSMAVAPFLPHTIPLIVGTRQIADAERRSGRLRVDVLEPPVDLDHNVAPSRIQIQRFQERWGIDPAAATVVCVTRLAQQLKLEGLLTTMRAIGQLAERVPVQLVVVGGGPAATQVENVAAEVNRRRPGTVVLTGELLDPRPAYAAADVVVGMGSSALRALAFGRPLIVQGENGYFRLLTPDTIPEFLWQGWYGVGDATDSGIDALLSILDTLLSNDSRREELGNVGRQLVEDRFSLERAASRQIEIYHSSLSSNTGLRERSADLMPRIAQFASYKWRRRVDRLSGRRIADDFNARPVSTKRTVDDDRSGSEDLLIYIAGVPWNSAAGTDRQLVSALSASIDVLWIDPPVSPIARQRARRAGRTLEPTGVDQVISHVFRLRVGSPPGFTRPVVRDVANALVARATRRVVRQIGRRVQATILAAPEGGFASGIPGARLYYVTDDWPEGAAMMGLRSGRVRHELHKNMRAADVVLAVSPVLADRLSVEVPNVQIVVLPNGCNPEVFAQELHRSSRPTQVAGLVGRLNERLDLDALEAVAASGVEVLVVGPRFDNDPETVRRLDRFLSLPSVRWEGLQPIEKLPHYLAQMSVGLTPYADTEFNRASFPLKTLEYLAAGLPVVSTDLPAVRWLDSDLIVVASRPQEFADRVTELANARDAPELRIRRREFAAQHSWRARADAVLVIATQVGGWVSDGRAPTTARHGDDT